MSDWEREYIASRMIGEEKDQRRVSTCQEGKSLCREGATIFISEAAGAGANSDGRWEWKERQGSQEFTLGEGTTEDGDQRTDELTVTAVYSVANFMNS